MRLVSNDNSFKNAITELNRLYEEAARKSSKEFGLILDLIDRCDHYWEHNIRQRPRNDRYYGSCFPWANRHGRGIPVQDIMLFTDAIGFISKSIGIKLKNNPYDSNTDLDELAKQICEDYYSGNFEQFDPNNNSFTPYDPGASLQKGSYVPVDGLTDAEKEAARKKFWSGVNAARNFYRYSGGYSNKQAPTDVLLLDKFHEAYDDIFKQLGVLDLFGADGLLQSTEYSLVKNAMAKDNTGTFAGAALGKLWGAQAKHQYPIKTTDERKAEKDAARDAKRAEKEADRKDDEARAERAAAYEKSRQEKTPAALEGANKILDKVYDQLDASLVNRFKNISGITLTPDFLVDRQIEVVWGAEDGTMSRPNKPWLKNDAVRGYKGSCALNLNGKVSNSRIDFNYNTENLLKGVADKAAEMLTGFCEKLEAAKQTAMLRFKLNKANIEIPEGVQGLYIKCRDRYYFVDITGNRPVDVSIVRIGPDKNVAKDRFMSDFLSENPAELVVAAVLDYSHYDEWSHGWDSYKRIYYNSKELSPELREYLGIDDGEEQDISKCSYATKLNLDAGSYIRDFLDSSD